MMFSFDIENLIFDIGPNARLRLCYLQAFLSSTDLKKLMLQEKGLIIKEKSRMYFSF